MEVLHFILTGDRLRVPLVHGGSGRPSIAHASSSGGGR
jgi:hypothetical protein